MKGSSSTLLAVVAITIWALAAFAPATFGATPGAAGSCTPAQMQALKDDVSSIHAQTARARLTQNRVLHRPALSARLDALTAVCRG